LASKDFLEQRSLFDYDVEALDPWKANKDNANLNQQIRVPKEICRLMAELIYPTSYTTFYDPTTIYDPACGAAEVLLYMRQFYELKPPSGKNASLYLYGQEANPQKNCMATLNLLKHDCENVRITEGNALASPGFIDMTSLKTFDYVVSVLPWKQRKLDERFYQADKWERFCDGTPPQRFADWGWMQHILASLKPQGRAAVLVGTGAITRNVDEKRGSEQIIRSMFIKRDLIEAVILLPDNLFSNTTVPYMLLLLCRNKQIERREHILLIDASRLYRQEKSKKRLTSESIESIKDTYQCWETREDFSKIITLSDAEQNIYNLNPPLYIEKHLTTKSDSHPLAKLYSELENIRTQHQQIYRELIQV
jgi:type I restriction enzyme M protein